MFIWYIKEILSLFHGGASTLSCRLSEEATGIGISYNANLSINLSYWMALLRLWASVALYKMKVTNKEMSKINIFCWVSYWNICGRHPNAPGDIGILFFACLDTSVCKEGRHGHSERAWYKLCNRCVPLCFENSVETRWNHYLIFPWNFPSELPLG